MSFRVLLKVLLSSGFRILFSGYGLAQSDTPHTLQQNEAIKNTI